MLEFYAHKGGLVVKHLDEWWQVGVITGERIILHRISLPAYSCLFPRHKADRLSGVIGCGGELNTKTSIRCSYRCSYWIRDIILALQKREFAFVDPLTHRWDWANPYPLRKLPVDNAMEVLVKLSIAPRDKNKAFKKPRRTA